MKAAVSWRIQDKRCKASFWNYKSMAISLFSRSPILLQENRHEPVFPVKGSGNRGWLPFNNQEDTQHRGVAFPSCVIPLVRTISHLKNRLVFQYDVFRMEYVLLADAIWTLGPDRRTWVTIREKAVLFPVTMRACPEFARQTFNTTLLRG